MSRGRAGWLMGVVPVAAVAALTCGLNRVAFDELGPKPLAPLEPLAQVGALSAERCGACHVDLKREWDESHHAQAVTDPLYVADLAHQGAPYFCDRCHAPLTEQQPKTTTGLWLAWPRLVPRQSENPRYDAALHREGVTCVACHQFEGAMLGPHETKSAPHAVRVTAELGAEALCEKCHTLALTSLGDLQRPLMETVTEWREYRRLGGERACVDCHMPRVPDRSAGVGAPPRPGRSHRLRGPRDLELVRTALEVREVAAIGEQVKVTVFNGTGHRLPTAEPHRSVEVALELLDGEGVVGKSAARLERRVDLDALEETGADTTLLPRETRTLTLSLPKPTRPATHARLTIDLWLWQPNDAVAVAAGLGPGELARRIYEAEVPLR